MAMALLFLLTFASGAAYESGYVFRAHFSEQGRPRLAALVAVCNVLVTVIGIESFLWSPILVVAYVTGYGVGTFIAIRFKQRLAGRTRL